jgi:succinate dehydrogenase / fumarate reductase cytochrome b subunit
LGTKNDPYDNVVADFREWPVTLVYTVALIAIGLHVRHGIRSAAASLGRSHPALPTVANCFALLLTAGFVSVPFCVVIGAVR